MGSIILSLTDEYITNMKGDDIYIETYRTSHINANVSISYDGKHFKFLGELTNLKKSFDLEDINYEKPVKYIRFNFHCDMIYHRNNMTPRNIISVYGFDNPYYSPSYSYFISPKNLNPIIIYDCEKYYPCNIYCNFRVNNKNINSCISGCNKFISDRNCDCLNINFNKTDFNVDECMSGCSYRLSQELYPNYTILTNTDGIGRNLNSKCINEEKCFDETLNNCNSDDNCHSLSIYKKRVKEFNSLKHIYKKNSLYIVKNEMINGKKLHYHTTSATSTPTSTLTQTPTSTLTQTPTSTLTQTETSTLTQTETSTLTQTETHLRTYPKNYITRYTTRRTGPEDSKSNKMENYDVALIIGIIITILIMILLMFCWLIYDHKKINNHNKTKVNESISFENPIYERNSCINNDLYETYPPDNKIDTSPIRDTSDTSNTNFTEGEYIE